MTVPLAETDAGTLAYDTLADLRDRTDGADAVLVGESVVTAEDPTAAVAALVAAGKDDT
jgi:indole-3-glycerol phosphate synthase